VAIKITDTWRSPSRGTPDQIKAALHAAGVIAGKDVDDFVDEVYRLCGLLTLDAVLLIAHVCVETGGGTDGIRPFSSPAWATVEAYRDTRNRYNPAGIGITDVQDLGYRFAGGKEAAQAHVVHHARYEIPVSDSAAWTALLPYISLDPRYSAVPVANRGTVKTVNDLGGKWWSETQGAANLAIRGNKFFPNIPDQLSTPPIQASGGTTVPTTPTPTTYAPPKLLKLFTDADAVKAPMTRDKNGVYFNIPDTTVTATEDTAAYQWADPKGAPKTADVKKGETRVASWSWTDTKGDVWLYDTKGERLVGKFWDGLFTIPDTNPGGVITGGGSAAITDYSQVTAANYKTVKDPSILLPPIVWKGSPNFFANRAGKKPIAMCYHVTDDLVLNNTISWFQNSSSQASSHFVIDTDGTVYQFVSSTDGAWTNGDFELNGQLGYRTDIPALVNSINAGPNLNDYTITIEHVGKPNMAFPQVQIDASIRLARYFAHPAVYGLNTDRSHQWRHSDVNALTREYCPSPTFPLDRIITSLGGDPAKLA